MDAGSVGAQGNRRAGLHLRTRERSGGARRTAQTAYGEVVWSWRPDAGVKSCGSALESNRARIARSSARRWWQQSPAHQGEREVSRKTIRAGRAGVIPPGPVVFAPLRNLFARGPTGACGRPAFPAPSIKRARTFAKLGRMAPRECARASLCCLKIEAGNILTSSRRRPEAIQRSVSLKFGGGELRKNHDLWLWVLAFARTRTG
jgi:hypothetical protein